MVLCGVSAFGVAKHFIEDQDRNISWYAYHTTFSSTTSVAAVCLLTVCEPGFVSYFVTRELRRSAYCARIHGCAA